MTGFLDTGASDDRRRHRPRLLAVLVVVFCGWFGASAVAQDSSQGSTSQSTEAPAPVTAEDLESLVGTIEDAKRRAAFIKDLKALIAAHRQTPPAAEDVTTGVVGDLSKRLRRSGRGIMHSLRPDILEPLEVQGVNTLADSAVIIRARIKVRAGVQWSMRRAFNRRMKLRFDELGIEIPFPQHTVHLAKPPDPASAPPRQPAPDAAAPRLSGRTARDDGSGDGSPGNSE